MKSLTWRGALAACLVWVLCAAGLTAALATPAWAGGKRTEFAGTETITGGTSPVVIPAGSKFHVLATQFAQEAASDPRVSGSATITANAIWDLPAMTGPMWGSYRLVNPYGEWNGHWQGSRTMNQAGDVRTWIVATCVGSGAYRGLVARWDISGLNVGPTNPYLHYEGFIVEATPGRTDLPMTWSAMRTETLNVGTLEVQILSEVGEGTHIGRSGNSGFGFLVPTSPTTALVTGTGRITAANGDQIFWVVSGVVDLTGQTGAAVSIFFAGGTGRFDEAIGQMDGIVAASFGPPDANGVMSATFDYTASGTIRY